MTADIGITFDTSDLEKASQQMSLEVAKMVQTIVAADKKIETASKASADIRAEAERRVTAIVQAESVKQDAAIRKTQMSLAETINKVTGVTKAAASDMGATYEKLFGVNLANQVKSASVELDRINQLLGVSGQKATEAGASFSRLGEIIENEARQARAFTDALNERMGITGSRATDNGAGFGALEAEMDRLTAKFNPLYANSKKYEQAVEDLNRAKMHGIVVGEAYDKALEQINQEYQRFLNTSAAASGAVNQFGSIGRVAGMRVNNFGMYAQQAGYQIADFAVQVQMGTSLLVALGQQGSQFLAMIPGWGAVAGAVLAIGAAFGTLLINMNKAKEEADHLDDKFQDLKELNPIFESIGSTIEMSLGDSIDRVRDKFGDFVADVVEFRANELNNSLKSGLQNIGAPGTSTGESSWDWRRAIAMIGGGVGIGGTTSPASDEAIEKWHELQDILSEVNGKTVPEIVDNFVKVYESFQGMGEEGERIQSQMMQVARNAGIEKDVLAAINEESKEQTEHTERASEFIRDQVRDLDQKLQLAQAEQRYGQDSLQYLEAQQQIEKSNLALRMTALGVSEEERSAILDQLAALQEVETEIAVSEHWAELLRDALGEAAGNAAMVAATDMVSGISSAAGAALALAQNLTLAVAQANAFNAAKAAGVFISGLAGNVGGVAFGVNNTLANAYSWAMHNIPAPPPVGMPLPGSRPDSFGVDMDGDGVPDSINAGREADAKRAARGGGRGGGQSEEEKAAERVQSILDDLQKEIDFKESLIGKNEEERNLLEHIYDIQKSLGENADKVSQERIRQLAEEQISVENLIKAQEDAEDRRKQLIEGVENNFKDAVMSFVNDSKSVNDAFRDMLRQMILDIYEQQVLDRYTKYAGNFLTGLFSANGNVFGPSGHISYFAKGDVFSSPTAFSYGSGQMGVMGEAGPEAVMPLKRGPDGKLGVSMNSGAQGNTTVVQNFHISANGDDSVKRIIRGEMPRIAEAAKGAVLEAQKRNSGGFRK